MNFQLAADAILEAKMIALLINNIKSEHTEMKVTRMSYLTIGIIKFTLINYFNASTASHYGHPTLLLQNKRSASP